MSHQSILAHLAPLLTNQLENVATDALAHLLLEYSVISDSFQDYISQYGIVLPKSLKFRTQATAFDGAIPDLVGIDSEDRYILIIESKFWAYLTQNQPATYIKRLPPETPAILLFISPSSRFTTLWPELVDRCKIRRTNDSIQESGKTPFLTAKLNKWHLLGLTSWEAMLAVFYQKAQEVGDIYASGDIWQLQSLCARIEEEAFHPLSEQDNVLPTEQRISQIRSLLDELLMCLIDAGIASTEGYRATPGPNYYKRYMSIYGLPKSDWCVEFNTWYQQKYPQTNLWFSASKTAQSSNLLSESNILYYRYEKQFLIPLEFPQGVEREEVLNGVYEQIVDIVNRLIDRKVEV